jgi:DNA-binding response OmpR family regulator
LAAIRPGSTVEEETIDAYVRCLKKKLGRSAVIESVQNEGYRFQGKPIKKD